MPLKRHPALVPLSRDHHDGLLLAIRLQQGKRALERLWSHDAEWQATYVVEFFEKHLTEHFRIEEEVLFPEVRKLAGADLTLVDALADEHAQMRDLVASLRSRSGSPIDRVLVRFGEILEGHIRREERVLFPFCESRMEPRRLEELSSSLNH